MSLATGPVGQAGDQGGFEDVQEPGELVKRCWRGEGEQVVCGDVRLVERRLGIEPKVGGQRAAGQGLRAGPESLGEPGECPAAASEQFGIGGAAGHRAGERRRLGWRRVDGRDQLLDPGEVVDGLGTGERLLSSSLVSELPMKYGWAAVMTCLREPRSCWTARILPESYDINGVLGNPDHAR